MHLNKPSKVVLGIVTFLPFLMVVGAFLVGIYQVFSFVFADDPMMPMLLLSYLGYMLPYLFFFFLFYLGLGIFYLIHIAQNRSLDFEKKFLWIVILITLNGIAMPTYWYVHIWKNKMRGNFQSKPSFKQAYESRTESEEF
jgi:hypothetical protein